MALANVARWFQLCGLNVRIVDWDLEAPGIDTFLLPADRAEAARAQLGLLDLLDVYKQLHANLGLEGACDPLQTMRTLLPPMQHALVDVAAPDGWPPRGWRGPAPGRLQVLGAGWRPGERFAEYANGVQAFDWQRFYADYHGLSYFDWLREQLLHGADLVLIDSRTGVTEMGGVCTRQMADLIVALVAPNEQNLQGMRHMAKSLVL